MSTNLAIVRINTNYCEYLRNYDNKVSYNSFDKESRPFIGILFCVNDLEYFAPLSSPKAKHLKMKNTLDFLKIKNGELGAINFNNMIPIYGKCYDLLDLNEKLLNVSDIKYQSMLKSQLSWLNANIKQLHNKSYKLYNMYKNNNLPQNIRNRCCDFILLEEKCLEYNKN